MSILSKISEVATGGLVSELFDAAKAYFPPSMTDQEKQLAQIAIEKVANTRAREIDQAVNEAQQLMTEQIAALEGTANDLRAVPFIGAFIVFLRGCQRPVWGFFTMYLDADWLTTAGAGYTEQQQTALIVINVLVLGFLFGERAIKNVMPLITKMVQAKVK